MPSQAAFIWTVTLAFVASGVGALLWTTRRVFRRGGDDADPRCGRCGYIVHRGTRGVCPECGASLAEVGVFTPAGAPPEFPLFAVWLIGALLALTARSAGERLAGLTPWGWQFQARFVIETSRANRVYLNNQGFIGVEARGTGRWGVFRTSDIRVEYISPIDRLVQMQVSPDGRTCQLFLWATRTTPQPLDRQAVRVFVRSAEFDPDSEEGARIETQLWDAIQRLLRHDFPPGSSSAPVPLTDASYYAPREDAAWVAGVAFWVVTMGIVLLLARRWHRWRRRRAVERSRVLLDRLVLAV